MDNDEPIFSFVLSDDKTLAKVILHESEQVLTGEQLSRVIRFLANERSQMLPLAPDTPEQSKPSEHYEADSFDIRPHRSVGTAQVSLRIPGLGWVTVVFHPEDCQRLAELFAMAAAPHPSLPGNLQ